MVTKYKETHQRAVGDDWNFDHTVTSTDANGVVTPVTGLTSATIISTIRHRDTNVQLWQGTRTDGQVSIVSDPLGQIRISVPRTTTDDLQERLYDMDLQVEQNNAVVTVKRWFVQALASATVP